MSLARHAAVIILTQVLRKQQSLTEAFEPRLSELPEKEQPLCKQLCFGVMRHYFQIQAIIAPLLKKNLRNKDADIRMILYIGIYQLIWLNVPDHAAINEMVELTKKCKKPWASKLVNAILRQVQRESDSFNLETLATHPDWLVEALQQDWPDDWPDIIDENQTHPPFSLRVNHGSVTDYMSILHAQDIKAEATPHCPSALVLQNPIPVTQLPNFDSGAVTVQDIAAQQVAALISPQPKQKILDACAAPGGKTTHLLHNEPSLQVTALDNKPHRLERIQQNLTREQLENSAVSLITGDAQHQDWWDGVKFDHILCDVPCSATGIIRRHPDIKVLRNISEIDELILTQRSILDNCWQMLKEGGYLFYTTCSVLKRENDNQVLHFLNMHPDATIEPITTLAGRVTPYGLQSLPGDYKQDGFYYAKIQKK